MLTLNFRQGKTVVVLSEAQSATVSALIAELAEILVETGKASGEEVSSLRLALETSNGWVRLDDGAKTLEQLDVKNNATIGFSFSDDYSYSYESTEPH